MNPPDEVFLKRAAECEHMAELTRDPESKFTWRRMAERWHRCAKVAASASLAAAHHSSEPSRHRKPAPVGHIGSGSEQRPGLNLAALSYPIQRPTKTPPGLVRAAVTGFTDPGGGLGGSAHIQGSALATFSTAHTFDHNAFQTESPTERPLPAHQRTERGQKSSCEKAPWGGNQTDRRAFWARVGGIPITPTAGRA